MLRIALVTEDRYVDQPVTDDQWYLGNILREDFLLAKSLARFAYQAKRVNWSDPDVAWSNFDALVIRSTWDYFERLPELLI